MVPSTPRPAGSPEHAIFQTLLYADIFDYPLTPAEIHHYLIATQATPDVVKTALERSPWLAERVTRVNGYVVLRDRAPIGEVREARLRSSARLWRHARRWGYWLGCLPFVRMVAVTGALAVDNAPPGDDIDFLLVTARDRVWLTRAFAVLLVRLARLFGVGLCPNYVLAETALAQPQRNLYSAHDLVQMVPLMGRPVYEAMLRANNWALEYLPQARRPLRVEPERAPGGWLAALKRLGERLLGGRLGAALEAWERRRKLRKFAPAAEQPGSAAVLDAERVKGHFADNGQRILQSFEERARRYVGAGSPTGGAPGA